MAILSTKQILQDNKTNDSNAITSLTLTFKALSDVSCLSDFKNLEKLDLTFNNLSSLEAIKVCVNLKWLAVVQNKLRSLKGIEALTKLTVLNAGKNKLNSMDEVTSVITLRALILNDNEITSIPKLHQMKALNTLVLSRNPIQEIGESMAKLKLISKISLSHCQIQTIGSSLKSCTELRELRLAHNGITVLSSLVNLRNLDLQGNPITEKGKLARKMKKLIPSLQIYNAKPIEKILENEDGRINDSSVDAGNMRAVEKPKQLDRSKESGSLENDVAGPSKDTDVDGNEDFSVEKKLKTKRKNRDVEPLEKAKKRPMSEDLKQDNKFNKDDKSSYLNPDIKNTLLPEKHEFKVSSKKKTGDKVQLSKDKMNVTIDDGEIPFSDFFTADIAENAVTHNENMKLKQDIHSGGEAVTFPKNKKKNKGGISGASALQSLMPANEIGLGGPSAWNE